MQESKRMTRRKWLIFTLALLTLALGCRKESTLPPDLFPESTAGGWRRTAVRSVPVSESPDPVPRNEVEDLREAEYAGPGQLQARVYRLRSAAVGIELSQRWRPSADTVFFSAGPDFVVVKWQSADRKALQQFLHTLESHVR
jgi:hypothetical protein